MILSASACLLNYQMNDLLWDPKFILYNHSNFLGDIQEKWDNKAHTMWTMADPNNTKIIQNQYKKLQTC